MMVQLRTSQPVERGELEQLLRSRVLVCDGAMGTMLHAAGVRLEASLPELNLSRPDLVRSIHGAYIESGSDIIETNTFGASRVRLKQYGLDERVSEINLAGARIARDAAANATAANHSPLVAGSVSPVTPASSHARLGDATIRAAFREQIVALVEGGIDLLLFETFANLDEAAAAIEVAKEVVPNLPLVAQMTFLEDGRTIAGELPAEVAARLEALDISALGANCTLGPQGILDVLRELRKHTDLPLTAQANAGSPYYVKGRFEYSAGAEYFARYAQRYAEVGAAIVGGCCGTTPDHIEAIAAAVEGVKPVLRTSKRSFSGASVRSAAEPQSPAPSALVESLSAGRFVLAGELIAPIGGAAEQVINDATTFRDAGFSAVLVAPSPGPRAQLSPVSLAALLEQRVEGIEAILAVQTWEKSVMSLQADLLGAHAFGVRHVLCRTGTPPALGDYANPGGIWDVDAAGLARLLRGMNEGRDHYGISLAQPTAFVTGARINPSAEDMQREVDDARRKIAAGIDFLVTAPVYDVDALKRLLDAIGAETLPPVLLGLTPLRDFNHAEYLQQEVPDVYLPDDLVERMRLARGDGRHIGLTIAREIAMRARSEGLARGVIISADPATALELATLLKEQAGS